MPRFEITLLRAPTLSLPCCGWIRNSNLLWCHWKEKVYRPLPHVLVSEEVFEFHFHVNSLAHYSFVILKKRLFWSHRFWFGIKKRNWQHQWSRENVCCLRLENKRDQKWSDPSSFLFAPLSHLSSVSFCLPLPTACSFLICNSDFLV